MSSGTATTLVMVDSAGPARLRVVADEADAAIATILARRPDETDAAWHRVLRSEGYRALHAREAAMGRAFTDSSFRTFLRSDSARGQVGAVQATLDRWRHADVTGAVRSAVAYLPEGTPIRATLYFEVKPRRNTFVFKTDSSPSLFVAVDPAVGTGTFTNELAHELHHIGYAAACPSQDDTGSGRPFDRVKMWMGAFGEGWAMLAAAGGPGADPHAADDSVGYRTWNRDYPHVATDMRALDTFFGSVLDRHLARPDTIQAVAMSFFGTAQGPWYTVGYLMVRTIEMAKGRPALLQTLCDPVRLVLVYQTVARDRNRQGDHLPLWSPSLVARLASASRGRT
jgi:hypothetical protein